MATKYHIAADGTPAPCRAQSIESCPKAQAGDSFHGTAEEVQAESQRRFTDEYGTLTTRSKSSPKPQAENFDSSTLDSNTIYATLTQFKDDTSGSMASVLRSQDFDLNKYDRTAEMKSTASRLAFDVASLPKKDKDYFVNSIPKRDLKLFVGEKTEMGKGNTQALVRIHKALVEKHGVAQPNLRIEDQLPAGSADSIRYDGRREGVGSFRTWGTPSNAIQNVSIDTAQMLAQHVIDRYGAENAEKFWSQASATSGGPRAKLSQVFQTMKKFDQELGAKS